VQTRPECQVFWKAWISWVTHVHTSPEPRRISGAVGSLHPTVRRVQQLSGGVTRQHINIMLFLKNIRKDYDRAEELYKKLLVQEIP
jgi:hypothetical protein